jgi:hypothetical protein
MADGDERSGYAKWIAIGISIVALVVSAASLVVSYFNYATTRQFSEINIQPHLETSGEPFIPPKSYIFVRNKGRGPAKLIKVEFRYDGKSHSRAAISGLFLEAQESYNKATGTDFQCRFIPGTRLFLNRMIQANEREIVYTTEGDCPHKTTDYTWVFLRRFSLYIDFQSLAGDVYTLTLVADTNQMPNFQNN